MTIHTKTTTVEFSLLMAPFYLINDDELLKAQLLNLNNQTLLSFEVIIPDPHYSKRSWLKEFCKELNYNLIHYRYTTNSKVPRMFDYGIFNNSSLISNSDRLVLFQDWRFCHHRLLETIKNINYDFIGFNWQILYMEKSPNDIHHPQNTIEISNNESIELYNKGLFPDLEIETKFVDTFHNSCWGHYCISKSLWLSVNGIDEVCTNTRHYADLDINTRLQAYYKTNNKEIKIPMLKNAMLRIMHSKGHFFGGSNIRLDYEVNQSHLKCCFVNTHKMNDKAFTDFAIEKIKKQEWNEVYRIDYEDLFKNNNKNESLDSEYYILGFQCKNCKVIGETPHWYEKSPLSKIKSLDNIGQENFTLGKDIKLINKELNNKSVQEKIEIVTEIWSI